MPRPIKEKKVRSIPTVTYFKPRAVPVSALSVVEIAFEELEALRLVDLERIEQRIAAEQMNVSQPTIHRLLVSARKTIADALVNGKAILINGGSYVYATKHIRGRCRNRNGRGARRSRDFNVRPKSENVQ